MSKNVLAMGSTLQPCMCRLPHHGHPVCNVPQRARFVAFDGSAEAGVCCVCRGAAGGGRRWPTTSRPGVFLETCLLPSALVCYTLVFLHCTTEAGTATLSWTARRGGWFHESLCVKSKGWCGGCCVGGDRGQRGKGCKCASR